MLPICTQVKVRALYNRKSPRNHNWAQVPMGPDWILDAIGKGTGASGQAQLYLSILLDLGPGRRSIPHDPCHLDSRR